MEVTVPVGLNAGDLLTVLTPDGETVQVVIPPGVSGGDDILVIGSASDNLDIERLTVTVPEGTLGGTSFAVRCPSGELFEVEVPEGAAPGDTIEISLPSHVASLEHPEPVPEAPKPSSAKFVTGHPVSVMRSTGSWSRAVVIAYDELSGTYTVRLEGGGALKHLVEESDLQEVDYSPPAAGVHYEGRRVQVYARMSKKPAWVDALIRSFHASTRTYTVELLCGGSEGGTLQGVCAGDIRVRQRV